MNLIEAIEYLQKDENNKVKDDEGNIYNMAVVLHVMNEDYITTGDILQMLDSEFEVVK